MHATLTQQHRLRVFWDDRELAQGLDFQRDFMRKLAVSRCFVPLVSMGVLEKWKAGVLSAASLVDNVLLEYTAAFELAGRGSEVGYIQRVHGIFVGLLPAGVAGGGGDAKKDQLAPPAASGTDLFPAAPDLSCANFSVGSVHNLLTTLFKELSLPQPPSAAAVKDVYAWASKANGATLWDGATEEEACAKVAQCVSEAKGVRLERQLEGGGVPRGGGVGAAGVSGGAQGAAAFCSCRGGSR